MDPLRLIFFSGLIFHKAVWEALKWRDKIPVPPETSLPKKLMKYLKVAVLASIGIQTLFLDLFPLTNDATLLRAIGLPVFLLGLGLAVVGRLQLGQNWANLEDSQVLEAQALVKNGIYHYIRHPIYTGDLLLLTGLELALNSWLVMGSIILALIIVRQSMSEETLLATKLAGYNEYRIRTKRFIPFLI